MTARLELRGIRKAFGAVTVADGVDLQVAETGCHALIGPNGAGKTSLMRQILGELAPDAGRILLDGRDITGLGTPARARLGLAATAQVSSLFDSASLLDNARIALVAARDETWRFTAPVAADPVLTGAARDLLAEVELASRAAEAVTALSHGERRLLEIALALARPPRLLLLDEPTAGLGPAESQALVARLAALKARTALLLVEHDMDAVFRLADRISVLNTGRLIASGAPEAIRRDPAVQAAYLGESQPC